MERRELSSAAGGAVSSRGPAAGLPWVVGTFCGCLVLPWGGGQVGEEASVTAQSILHVFVGTLE